MKIRKSILILPVLFALFAAPLFASAEFVTGSLVPCGTEKYSKGTIIDNVDVGGQISNPCTLCHLFEGTKTIIDFLTFNVAAPIVVIALLIGGFFLLTSGGSEQKRTKGREAITYAILGLIIVFGAWLILDLLLGKLIDANYWTWYQFPKCDVLNL